MTKKLDKEHLDQIQELRSAFATVTTALGNISIEEIMLQRQLEYLKTEKDKYSNQFAQLRDQETELMEKMRERYGEGQINIADGTFTTDSGLPQ